MVNFLTNLGVQTVPDFNVKALDHAENYHDYINGSGGNNLARNYGKSDIFDFDADQNLKILREIDFQSMALLIKMLERKTLLVNELKTFNDLAEKKMHLLNKQFFDDYGWLGMQINLIDNVLKHITARFRLRGFNEENSKKIGKNFENIFNIFKKNIEREIEVCNNED